MRTVQEQERVPAALGRLRRTALRVLTAHVSDSRGRYVVCGLQCACEQALLAGWTLEVI